MRALLSRYRPSYITKLVYMLQASEYRIRSYLAWFNRTTDFNKIGVRQKLVLTKRSKLVLLVAWLVWLIGLLPLIIFLYVVVKAFFSPLVLFTGNSFGSLVGTTVFVGLVYLAFLPWFVAYAIILPIILARLLVQKPYEILAIATARRKIKNHPAIKIAIAGSFGKTTMKEILKTVLGEGKTVAATIGNQNTPIGISRFSKTLTGKEEVLIFEYGEYKPGDVKGFIKLTNPEIGIITGVNEAHLSEFKSLKATTDNIFTLANSIKPSRLYVNVENAIAKKRATKRMQHFSRKGVGKWKVTNIVANIRGTHFKATRPGKVVVARSRLLGIHQVGPLAAAIAIADSIGLDESQIEKGIAKTKPFEHRLQPSKRAGVTIIDDTYNGNPDGVAAALDFLKHLKASRKIYVTPGLVEMGSRSQEVHQEIGKQLAKVVDVVMLIQSSVTPFIEGGLREARFKGELLKFDDPQYCYDSLELFTRNGDVVLLQNDWPEHYL